MIDYEVTRLVRQGQRSNGDLELLSSHYSRSLTVTFVAVAVEDLPAVFSA